MGVNRGIVSRQNANCKDATVVDYDGVTKKLKVLKAEQYPLGPFFWEQISKTEVDFEEKQIQFLKKLTGAENDPFANTKDKESLDKILASWAVGKTGDDLVLTQLMPFAVRYHYGVEDDLDSLDSVLTEEQRKDFPFAQLVTDTWYNIKGQSSEDIQLRHESNLSSILSEHLLGMDDATLKKKFQTDVESKRKKKAIDEQKSKHKRLSDDDNKRHGRTSCSSPPTR